MNPLLVAIDARLPDSGQGGVQHVIKSLAQGMTTIDGSLLKRRWLVYRGTTWWKNTLPPEDAVIEVRPPIGRLSVIFAQRCPQITSRIFPMLSKLLSRTLQSADLINLEDVHVLHAPFQDGFRTNIPTVYNPHDLQHLYFPNNFSRAQIRHRETHWRNLAKNAAVVMAASSRVRTDLHDLWDIQLENIVVIPVPPPVQTNLDDSILQRVSSPYFLYPAALWPHKNHTNLLKAVSRLRLSGHKVSVVLTGATGSSHALVARTISELDLSDSVQILGHVSDACVASLIRNTVGVIVPSLFEAMSLVVWEAQRLGTPVACSNVGSFPEQVGDSAILFNPLDAEDIADAMLHLFRDSDLRRVLISRGIERTKDLTPEKYALAMTGIYYQAAGRSAPAETVLARQQLLNATA